MKRAETTFAAKILLLLFVTVAVAFFSYFWYMRLATPAIAVFIVGFIVTLVSPRFGRFLLIFAFPLLPALVGAFFKNLPYNFLALPVFLLTAVFFATMLREQRLLAEIKIPAAYFYLLVVLFISAFFLIFRWYFPFLFNGAFLKDFPVSPSGLRISYGLVYPLCWLFIYFGGLLVTPLIGGEKPNKKTVFRLLGVSFFVLIVVALIQYLLDSSERVRSLLSDFNAFGSFSGMLFLGSLLFFRAESKIDRLLKKFLLLSSAGGVALSGVRSALLFIVAGIIFVIFSQRHRPLRILISTLLVFLAVFLFVQHTPLYERFSRSLKILGETEQDYQHRLEQFSSGRFQLTVDSLKMITNFPLSGVGTGNFCFFNQFQNYERVFVEDLSLNQHLLIFAENGIFGFIFYLLFFWQLLKTADLKRRLFVLTVFVVLGFNNFFWFAELIILFWILIIASETKANEAAVRHSPTWGKTLLLVSILILVNLFSHSRLNVKNWFVQKKIGSDFNYGLWYNELDYNGVFFWTRDRSGIFLPESVRRLRIAAAAPQKWLEHHRQKVILLLNGKEWQKITFSRPEEVELEFPAGKNFLDIIVDPVFVPARVSRSKDRRLLGVRLNFDWQLPYRFHWEKVRIESKRLAERGTYTVFWRSAKISFFTPLKEGNYCFRFVACGTALSDSFPKVILSTPEKIFRFELNDKFSFYEATFNCRKELFAEILLNFSNPRWDEKLKRNRLFFFRSAELIKIY